MIPCFTLLLYYPTSYDFSEAAFSVAFQGDEKMQKSFVIVLVLVLVVILSASGSAYADLLGELNASGGFRSGSASVTGTMGIYDSFTFEWSCQHVAQTPSLEPVFISDIGVTKTIPLTSDFDAFLSMLTNGIDESNLSHHALNYGHGGNESFFITKFVESYGTDFYGYEITGFTMTLNDGFLISPGTDPNGDGNWTDYYFDVTYEMYGEPIPEPTTLSLIFLGAIMLRKRKA